MRWPTVVPFESENDCTVMLQDWGRELVIVMEDGDSLTPNDVKRLIPILADYAEYGQLPQDRTGA